MNRTTRSNMEFYRAVYSDSKMWNGKSRLHGKHIIVYCEQGFGDTIQFIRYIPKLRNLGCKVTLHCKKELRRLFAGLSDGFLDKDKEDLPKHDFHVLSMDLPFLLGDMNFHVEPYLKAKPFNIKSNHLKIGIAWEGNPNHSNNDMRSCPLSLFEYLTDVTSSRLFMVQKNIHDKELLDNCDDLLLYGWKPICDFKDTASLIAAMDVIVTVDTSVLHLAGALGKPTFGILSFQHDPRWNISSWYPSVKLIRQESPGDWESVFSLVLRGLGKQTTGKNISFRRSKTSILLTGGVGDVIALESFFGDYERETLSTIYYATRNHKEIRSLFDSMSDIFPNLKNHIILLDDFSEFFALHEKTEVSSKLSEFPEDWPRVSDWSIMSKFNQFDSDYYTYNGSSLLKKQVADISHLDLPDKYVVLVPWSHNDSIMKDREFTSEEWAEVLMFIENRGLKGVVLNTGEPCNIDGLIDLTNQTTMPQSIEVLKRASGYIGVDSCLSILASQLFDDILFIKSNNSHLYRWKHVYYATKKDFSFIKLCLNQ